MTATLSEWPPQSRLAPTDAVDAAMDVLDRQVGQMATRVDDLLDAERISRGKLVLRRERVELSSVVHHAVDAARPMYESLDQELTVTLPQVPVYLNADPTRLAQIVGNLLNNACKFTERGGRIWLTVERRRSKEAGFDAHWVKPVDEIALRKLPADIGARRQEVEVGGNS